MDVGETESIHQRRGKVILTLGYFLCLNTLVFVKVTRENIWWVTQVSLLVSIEYYFFISILFLHATGCFRNVKLLWQRVTKQPHWITALREVLKHSWLVPWKYNFGLVTILRSHCCWFPSFLWVTFKDKFQLYRPIQNHNCIMIKFYLF